MKKIISAIVFLVASFNLSGMAASFKTEFASFRESVKVEPSVGRITPSEIPYSVYVRFSNFLLGESLKIYTLDHVVNNKAESLRDILYLNLSEIYCSDYELNSAVDNLYRVLIPGFCIYLMDFMEKQRIISPLVPKL